ncbi:MAG: GH25 family lysozyme [Minicystis sp.]
MKYFALGAVILASTLAACAPESGTDGEASLVGAPETEVAAEGRPLDLRPEEPGEALGPGAEPEAVTQCPRGPTTRGLDVSYHQGRIEWPSVRRAGVVFAFARVADGAGFVDPRFGENWAGMKAAGVMRGSYQFFRPAQDPAAQAAVLVREITARGGIQAGDLPPALDLEVTDGVDTETLRGRALVWLRHVESALGRTPIVYTSPSFWEDLGEDARFARYTLWIAHWEARCPALPGDWERWRFWQDTSDSAVPGIEGAVDTDWFNGSRADLEAFAGGRPRAQRDPAAPRAKPSAPPRTKPQAPQARRRRSAPQAVSLAEFLRVLSLP